MVDALSVYLLSDTVLAKVMPWKMQSPPEFHRIKSCSARFQEECFRSIKNYQRVGMVRQPNEEFNDLLVSNYHFHLLFR